MGVTCLSLRSFFLYVPLYPSECDLDFNTHIEISNIVWGITFVRIEQKTLYNSYEFLFFYCFFFSYRIFMMKMVLVLLRKTPCFSHFLNNISICELLWQFFGKFTHQWAFKCPLTWPKTPIPRVCRENSTICRLSFLKWCLCQKMSAVYSLWYSL